MAKDTIIYKFLSSYFALFNALINEFRVDDRKVLGSIVWKDEVEKQDISWEIELEETILIKVALLCDYLVRYHLILGDKIIVTENELKTKLNELGWDLNEAQEYINYLCSIEVKMVDEGEETDSFFVHF